MRCISPSAQERVAADPVRSYASADIGRHSSAISPLILCKKNYPHHGGKVKNSAVVINAQYRDLEIIFKTDPRSKFRSVSGQKRDIVLYKKQGQNDDLVNKIQSDD